MVIDPVCGMEVEPEPEAGSAEWHGTVYYFCSPGCLKQFEADPEKHLKSSDRPPV